MSLTGIPGRLFLPMPTLGGPQLVELDAVDAETRTAILAVYRQLHDEIRILRRALDVGYSELAANASGFIATTGIGASTQVANNFSTVGLVVAGSTQFTWTFGMTELDTTYGIALGLSGPHTLPTVMKFIDRVRLDFGAVTPTGLRADLLLFR